MAVNNSNYRLGYSSPGYTSPYSSTPTGIRPQRPRFGYSAPSFYPRPRSSASKPNPDSLSDSMINNYGSSPSNIDTSYNLENGNGFNDSYYSSGSSNYYSANESFTQPSFRSETGLLRNNSGMYDDSSMDYSYSGARPRLHDNGQNPNILLKPTSQFDAVDYNYNSAVGRGNYNSAVALNSTRGFKRNFQNNNNRSGFARNFVPPFKRKLTQTKMASKLLAWKCDLCSLNFTSQIPYDMHLRGAKHAKKLKTKQALSTVQPQADNVSVKSADDTRAFFCELCNVKANSSLQLQTHLEGSKHKSKLQPKDPEGTKTEKEALEQLNGKSNGSLVRSLPSDFDEPQPSKLGRFACDVCGITVNSQVQLEQHLNSKKHQNKVEGKPIIKGRKPKVAKPTTETETTDTVMEEEKAEATNETSTKVVGVKTLASSFVQGETLE